MICEALASGQQTLILRKGGIAEGRQGFAFQHKEFVLFPTFFHAQYEGIRHQVASPVEEPAERTDVHLGAFCRVERYAVLTAWADVERLERFHIWKPEVLKERFTYGEAPALHLAVVRAFQMEPTHVIPFEKRYGGCRSWVQLTMESPLIGAPALTDEAFSSVLSEIDNTLFESTLNEF